MRPIAKPPKWIKPQLTHLVDEAPTGHGWLHEIKYDGYRMHARIDGGKATLLIRMGARPSTITAGARNTRTRRGFVASRGDFSKNVTNRRASSCVDA